MFPQDSRPLEAEPAPPAAHRDRTPQRRGVAASLIGVALFSALVGFAVDRYVSTNFNPSATTPVAAAPTTIPSVPRIGSVAAPSSGAAVDPAQQAIQQVIQRGDEEQAQAVASNDPSVMQDTSTADFYQQQVQTNQDLVANGVTAIALANIEWGPVTITDTTASATAWETWTTTYADGTTDQSRDRNVYTLVQDNGTWKVSADDHPDDLQASGPGGGVDPAHRARAR